MPPVGPQPSRNLRVRIGGGCTPCGRELLECVYIIVPVTHNEEVGGIYAEGLTHKAESRSLVKASVGKA